MILVHIVKSFHKEIITQIDPGNHFCSRLSIRIAARLDLYNASSSKKENRIGIRVVSTTMGAFQRID